MIALMVKVIPNSKRYAWKMEADGLKCYVPSPAIDGKANAAFIKKLAKLLKVPVRMITIAAGEHTRVKKVLINTELSYDELVNFLCPDQC